MVKQITIISGKGGTGKTTICAAFASLANGAVIADCDVDAADMHLILRPEILQTSDFYGLKVANINANLCTKCGECLDACRFGAISHDIAVNTYSCEGCGVCEYLCSQNAISLIDKKAGECFNSMTRFGPMAHAKLGIGEEASGKLVSAVRKNAQELAKEYGKDLIIIDGPPGIGCSVIAAINGVDLVVIVTEPTVSGIHDLERVLGLAEHFRIPAVVCINKYDINEENTQAIQEFCGAVGVDVLAQIPYDRSPVAAMLDAKTVVEYSDDAFSSIIRSLWEKINNYD
jgi:MinD superfamily P-loop ATPase